MIQPRTTRHDLSVATALWYGYLPVKGDGFDIMEAKL